jgi:putative ABC transport system permease protein
MVGDVCRNYFGRNLYISKEDYVATFGEQPQYNTLLVRVNKAKEGGFVSKLQEKFPQVTVVYTDVMPQAYEDPASLFHIMVFVMTLLSIVLSVFVLSNLVAIFVQRRNNELIVMGINGFSFSQQIGYLLKETLITTCMGLLLGTVMGCVMTAFVVKMVEGADAMFVRTPDPKAWLFAVAMEALFALCINLVAFRRVKHLSLTDFTR